ncbi:hypothetical protein JAAARDRAFT_141615, partial [Jaapia argillacea MUCL 33604]
LKSTFFQFEEKVVFFQDMENFMHYLPMFFQHVCEDEDIIQVYNDNSTVNQAEEHDHGFEQPLICFECRFPLVAILDTDIVVSPS